jgi:dUTP pyrophosphatase
MRITVEVQELPNRMGLPLPEYQTLRASGLDVEAALAVGEEWQLKPGERLLVPTGLAVAVPMGYELQVRPRSGLASQHGISVANSPGTIDGDYRGEVGVILINLGDEPFLVKRGDRIAQLVLAPVAQVEWTKRDRLPETTRSTGGFGSTGR